MVDVKPSFVFVGVDGEDVVEERIEVEEKPLITQDPPAQSDPKPAERQTRKKSRRKKQNFTHTKRKLRSSARLENKRQQSDINKNNDSANGADSSEDEQVDACETSNKLNHSTDDLQITNVVSKAESIFENNNDSDLKTSLVIEDECEDPLQNHCDVETTKDVAEDPICDIPKTPAPSARKSRKSVAMNPICDIPKKPAPGAQKNRKAIAINPTTAVTVNITSLVPYIKKLCANCQSVAELIQNDINAVENKICSNCFKPVAYCCKFCLEISTLDDILIHAFKDHFSNSIFSVANPTNDFICSKCGVNFVDSMKLKLHELVCDELPNLFCEFCPKKLKTKGEMRKHYICKHDDKFKVDELEEMLKTIVEEGDTVINLLTRHHGYCNTCKKHVLLTNRPIFCLTCETRLVYHCKDSACSSLVYAKLSSLQSHLRYHVNSGWTTKNPKPYYNDNRKRCHICGNLEGNRNKHMAEKHPDILRCKCDVCGKVLKNVRVWKTHRKKYCPVVFRKLNCGHCWFRSFEKSRLRKHLRDVHTHLYTGERSRCEKCGITWAGLYRLRWHSSRCSGDFKVERARQKELWARRGVVTLS